ncbi:unnamed protein product [Somion occarium]|uniref:Uncharacterized protein n=1 Tax=Somion occarium TaxID=3059160 RepID=A0ABP1CFP6_9APHY
MWVQTGSDQSESGTSINDTGGAAQDRGRCTIADGLVDTPELRSGGCARNWTAYLEPVNFEESVPPKVNSPFVDERDVVGSNDTATKF